MLLNWFKYLIRGLKVLVSSLLILLFVFQQFPFNLFSSPLVDQVKQCSINGNGCSCKGPVCMCMLYKHWDNQKHPLANDQLCPCTRSHNANTLYSFSISRTLITKQVYIGRYLTSNIYRIQIPISFFSEYTSRLIKPPQVS